MYDMRKKLIIVIFLYVGMAGGVYSQNLLINEVQSSNTSTIYDHTGDTPDWIEIYNADDQAINLENYGLSDKSDNPFKWVFPSVTISPAGHLLVFASGLDLKNQVLDWHTVIDMGDEWRYLVPKAELSLSWRNSDFNDSEWQAGPSGFGYGDNDDATVIEPTMSVFIRKTFDITDKQNVAQAYLHIDFDDAFVAYINGVEIARANIGNPGDFTAFNAPADNYNHEAKMYQGGQPDAFLIDNISDHLVDGENVLAIQIHNHSISSSDLTAIPFLTLGFAANPGFETSISPNLHFVSEGLHTNFKIASEGEHILLTRPDSVKVDSIFTSIINANISLGRKPDGSDLWYFFDEPTPGFPNSTVGFNTSNLPAVVFSSPGGKYSGSVTLQLTTDGASDSIFYTTDGSEPTVEDRIYEAPIFMNTSRIVRARVIKDGFLPGQIISNSYLINASHDLPVVFVNTDPYNLWDNEYGIYLMGSNASQSYPHFGANFWEDWERPANIAMYEADGTPAFQIDAGIKIFGAWSRGQDQKSLSIHTRKSYGYDGINYKIFSEKEIDRFETLVLRNSGNDFNNTMLRDAFCNRITSSLGLDQQAYRPAVVYLNGAYWGIQNIREKVNEEFIAANHGIDDDKIDILEGNASVVRGSSDHYEAMIQYIQANNLSSDQHYNFIKTQMDIPNFINYQIAQIFNDNKDWPGNNIKYWRERNAVSKWRWIMFDSDFGINIWDTNNQAYNTLQFALEPNGPGWPNPPWSTFLLRSLMLNSSFKHDFINAFADHLNTIFTPEILENHLNEMIAGIDGEISAHLSKWNGNMGYWNDRIAAMRSFIRGRRGNVRNHIRSVFGLSGTFNLNVSAEGNGRIKLNTLVLSNFPWDGIYYNNVPVQLEAIPDPGYRFIEWKGVENSTSEKLTINTDVKAEVTAVFQKISEPNLQVVINEINYSSSETFDVGDWVELLNAGDYSINISGWMLKDNDDDHVFVFPENTVVQSRGFVVVCRDRAKFRAGFPVVDIVDGAMDFGLGSDEDCVRLFTDEGLKVDEVCYTSQSPWPVEANGMGATLALTNAFSNNAHPSNWEPSMNYGTPGKKNTDIITNAPESYAGISDIHIYPNPAKGDAIIKFESPFVGYLNINIIDTVGRKHYISPGFAVAQGDNDIPISFDHGATRLTPGLYVVHLEMEDFIGYTKLLIEH